MTVTIDELVKELGFCVVPTKEKLFRLDEVRFNLLAYLEDYSKMGFSFVKVATDLVKLRKEQESYRLLVSVFRCFCHWRRGTSLLTLQSRRKGSFSRSEDLCQFFLTYFCFLLFALSIKYLSFESKSFMRLSKMKSKKLQQT